MKVSLLKFLCLVSVLLAIVGCSKKGVAELTIVNQSDETVVLLQVTVDENIQTVRDLKHGEQAKMRFLIKRPSDYHIDIEFNTGRTMWKDVGYLMRRASISDKVIIHETGIEFRRVSRWGEIVSDHPN